jgi:hypothetical protein
MQDTQQTSESMIPAKPENIVAGPSKFELALGLFDHTMTNGRTVTFLVGNAAARVHDESGRELGLTGATPVKVAINEVGRESGDGESWLFEGYVPGGAKSVEGYYSTRTNTGWLKRSTR